MLFLNNPTLLKITPKEIFISPKEKNFSPNKKNNAHMERYFLCKLSFLSLNHDFFTIDDIKALHRRFALQSSTIQSIPNFFCLNLV